MSLQPLDNKLLSRGIIGKSAPLFAEITLRKSQYMPIKKGKNGQKLHTPERGGIDMQRVLSIFVGVLLWGLFPLLINAQPIQTEEVYAAIKKAAQRLVEKQNPDGGWFMYGDDTSCDSEVGRSCFGTRGLNGLALIEAHRAFPEKDMKEKILLSVLKTADGLLQDPQKPTQCLGYPSLDAAFLFEVSQLGVKDASKYAKQAKLLTFPYRDFSTYGC